MMNPIITVLDKVHELERFNCGNDELNRWLGTIARQHQANFLSQTLVLVDENEPGIVLGFYALALRSMTPKGALPASVTKKLSRNSSESCRWMGTVR